MTLVQNKRIQSRISRIDQNEETENSNLNESEKDLEQIKCGRIDRIEKSENGIEQN